MYNPDDTIVALSTPPGEGAIAVIRLSGKKAVFIIDKLFAGKSLSKQKSHTLHYGVIKDGGKTLDEVVVGLFKAPNSYTTEDVVEVSCHGSVYIQQELVKLFIKRGARLAQPGEFTLRAFLNSKIDLSQAEAVADLIASSSEASHKQALQQMKGGITNKISELRERLIQFASLIELELDFSEEDVEFADRKQLLQLVRSTRQLLNNLITSFQFGNAIKNGIPVVIAGKPNAGKSTLLNVLLDEERAIVSEIPGTTRDTIEETVTINGILYRLIDTAGIRDATDKIEELGVARTMEKLKSSAIIVYVFDVNDTNPADLKKDIEKLAIKDIPVILVGNKIDTNKQWQKKFKEKGIIFLSSKVKLNIDKLLKAIEQKALKQLPQAEGVIISNVRHYELLTKADQALKMVESGLKHQQPQELLAIEIKRGLQFLGEVTGEVTTDDLLDNIFKNFCIGK